MFYIQLKGCVMNSTINKLKKSGQFVEVHLGAEADIPKLNELLRNHSDYIEGIEFTVAEKVGSNAAQFYYDHPDSFTPQESDTAQRIVSEVKADFMASK
jgi:hypothetical protein